MLYDAKWKSSFRRRLLSWFRKNARDLPWRDNKTPYRIWVSEIMLQQTQVATVIDYYQRFMKRFPTVEKLASAEQSEVLKLWEGLGYYRRARQMHAAAQIIADQWNGEFPTDIESVLSLPGIGRYSAGAILSISLDRRLPILEGNTIRLFARLLQMRSDPRTGQNQKILWRFSEQLIPQKNCGDFNQALMELGSKICRPKNPACSICPVRDSCPTRIKGLQNEIPFKSQKTKYEDVNEAVVLIERRGKYLVRKCGEGQRWAGLWDFPRFETKQSNPNLELSTRILELSGLSTELVSCQHQIKHAVTRFRITLDCFRAVQVSGRLKRKKGCELVWQTKPELKQLPMSITGRKIVDRLESLTT